MIIVWGFFLNNILLFFQFFCFHFFFFFVILIGSDGPPYLCKFKVDKITYLSHSLEQHDVSKKAFSDKPLVNPKNVLMN